MASPSNPPELPSRNWMELPPELTTSIFHRVGALDVFMNARGVCRSWRQLCSDPEMWRVMDLKYSGDLGDIDLRKVARKAVDMSAGQLVELSVYHFGDDALINYIADRSSRLRCLHLQSCSEITNEGLSEMLRKLPLLEELHLYRIRISKQMIEVARHCCPQLKTFKLNDRGFRKLHIGCDENTLAIAENMRGIRHLQLFGNRITEDGLLAILENCPHLESLDIRHCYKAAILDPDLERRLSQQIKYLRLPYDSVDDSEFKPEILEFNSSDEDDYFAQSDSDIDPDYYDFMEIVYAYDGDILLWI